MSESENKSSEQRTAGPQRWKLGLLNFVGLLLMNFGFIFATMKTVNHLKQQPPEPLLFDFTLRRGDGGFIAYGVATGVLGLILLWIDFRRRKGV